MELDKEEIQMYTKAGKPRKLYTKTGKLRKTYVRSGRYNTKSPEKGTGHDVSLYLSLSFT